MHIRIYGLTLLTLDVLHKDWPLSTLVTVGNTRSQYNNRLCDDMTTNRAIRGDVISQTHVIFGNKRNSVQNLSHIFNPRKKMLGNGGDRNDTCHYTTSNLLFAIS